MENNFLWIFALLILFFFPGFGGNRGPVGPAPATQEYVQEAINNQSVNQQLNAIALSSANNNYETARLIQQQSFEMQQQNNTNLVNAIQGFNQVGAAIQNQTNIIQSILLQLGAKMDECCCSIKTQMLQDRLQDRDRQLAEANNAISNYNQSQYLLSQLGKFVPTSGGATT